MDSVAQSVETDESQAQLPMPAQTAGESRAAQVPPDGEMSADEIAQYDRQIRLWGMDAQEKLRSARVLLIGLKALGNEVAKNLALAGIGCLTVVDDEKITSDDLGGQFLITKDDVGKARSLAAFNAIRRLNPRATIDFTNLSALLATPELFGNFSLVIVTDLPFTLMSTIDAACRLANRPFYAAGSMGLFGFVFADLLIHTFVVEREQSNRPTQIGPETDTRTILTHQAKRSSDGKAMEVVTKSEMYTPLVLANTSPLPPHSISSRRKKLSVTPILACIRALFEYQVIAEKMFPSDSKEDTEAFVALATSKHKELQLPPETLRNEVLRNFLQNLGTELSPTCAFLGGALTQDVINVLSGREQPIQNFLIFDGEDTKGPVYCLQPPKDLQPMPAAPLAVNNGFAIPDSNSFAVSNSNGFPASNGNVFPQSARNGFPASDGNGFPASEGHNFTFAVGHDFPAPPDGSAPMAGDYGVPPFDMVARTTGMPGAGAAELPQRERDGTASSQTLLGDEPAGGSTEAPAPGNEGARA